MGDDCDSCKPFRFNLQINNPLGCQSCEWNSGIDWDMLPGNWAVHVKGHVTGRYKVGYHMYLDANVSTQRLRMSFRKTMP